MKYRIIEERDMNGHGHFEVELWQKGLFGYKWKQIRKFDWNTERYENMKFGTKTAVLEYVRSIVCNRLIVEEGTL